MGPARGLTSPLADDTAGNRIDHKGYVDATGPRRDMAEIG